jgi:GTPase SAR1 family protein
LHVAVFFERGKIIEILLKKGSNMHLKDDQGKFSPLNIVLIQEKYQIYGIFEKFIEKKENNQKINLIGDSGSGKSSLFNRFVNQNLQNISDINTGNKGKTSHKFLKNHEIIDCEGFKKDMTNFKKNILGNIDENEIILFVENGLNRNNEIFDNIQNLLPNNPIILVINKFDKIKKKSELNDLLSYPLPKNLLKIFFVKTKFRCKCTKCSKITFKNFINIEFDKVLMKCESCDEQKHLNEEEMILIQDENCVFCPNCINNNEISYLHSNDISIEKQCEKCNIKIKISDEFNINHLNNYLDQILNYPEFFKDDLIKKYRNIFKKCSTLILQKDYKNKFLESLFEIFEFKRLKECKDFYLKKIDNHSIFTRNSDYSKRINFILCFLRLHLFKNYNLECIEDNKNKNFSIPMFDNNMFYESIFEDYLNKYLNQHQLKTKIDSNYFLSNSNFNMKFKNNVDLLICGEETFEKMYYSIENAKSFIYIAGWQFNSQLKLIRENGDKLKLNELLKKSK